MKGKGDANENFSNDQQTGGQARQQYQGFCKRIKVCEGEKGRFVSMPSTQYTDRDGNKQYQDIFHPISKGARNALNQAVLNAYDIKLQQVQQTEIEVENTPDEEMSEPEDEPEPELSM